MAAVPGDSEAEENTKLTPKEKSLFDAIGKGCIDEVRLLLGEGLPVDLVDDHGMTPLQMAAYKASPELCALFLEHGANVNSNSHEHGYTALMFAALTGNKEVIRMLLEHGARTAVENAVHRTASQMAAFVGQHEAVSLINNFFSREDLEYYTQPHGHETEPKLLPELASSLYKYILIVNLNPVKLVMYLQSAPELLQHADMVRRILDILVEKMMKSRDTNEVMAIKFHYLLYIVKEAKKSLDEKKDNLTFFIKRLLNSTDEDSVPAHQERLIRSMLREFPYPESQLLQQMVRTLTTPEIMSNPSASNVLTASINGQRFASAEDKVCTTCGEYHAKTCVTCKSVNYCNKECQKLHWFVHKKVCQLLAEKEKKRQLQQAKQSAKKDLEESKQRLEETTAMSKDDGGKEEEKQDARKEEKGEESLAKGESNTETGPSNTKTVESGTVCGDCPS